jgi:hypothetical protein
MSINKVENQKPDLKLEVIQFTPIVERAVAGFAMVAPMDEPVRGEAG